MKKILCVSGMLTILLLPLILTGWAAKDNAEKESLAKGNKQFNLASYGEALTHYETGLAANPESKALNFNAAQAAYILGEYEKSAGYYENAENTIEKFLNSGNIFFMAAEAAQEDNQKAQFFEQALQIYKEGIINFPQNVPLKYNFELVKRLLEDIEQENDEQSEDGDSQENQEQESEDGQENQEQGSEDSEDGQENQEQESEDSEDEQGNQEQESEESEDSEDEQGIQGQESEDSENSQEDQENDFQNEEEYAADREAIERILQMLERQEEHSLKNNQEVIGGSEGKNAW